jgi:hypothetical protein
MPGFARTVSSLIDMLKKGEPKFLELTEAQKRFNSEAELQLLTYIDFT